LARLVGTRLVVGAVILWVVSVVVFAGTELLSGDAATAILGRNATPEKIAVVREQLDLDEPAPKRYAAWLGGILTGDLGESLSTGRPVTEIIGGKVRNSALLAGMTTLVLIPLSYLLGTLAAVRRYGSLDHGISYITLALIALPEFVVAILLVLTFAVVWPVLPAISFLGPEDGLLDTARALVLPVVALLAASIAHTTRMVRGSVIEALESEYVQMARLKGVPERAVVVRHALRNALVPSIQVMALAIGWLAGGVVVVEFVFQYPGIGQALVDAVSARDLPVVQVLALLIAAVYVVVNLFADILSIVLTPKLRTAL
jgi:peptide/nickel transport system permease protein